MDCTFWRDLLLFFSPSKAERWHLQNVWWIRWLCLLWQTESRRTVMIWLMSWVTAHQVTEMGTLLCWRNLSHAKMATYKIKKYYIFQLAYCLIKVPRNFAFIIYQSSEFLLIWSFIPLTTMSIHAETQVLTTDIQPHAHKSEGGQTGDSCHQPSNLNVATVTVICYHWSY